MKKQLSFRLLLLLVLAIVSIGTASATCSWPPYAWEPNCVLSNENSGGVESAYWYGLSAPPSPTTFTFTQSYFITRILDYHYYNEGELPGTISLKNVNTGEVLGPWTTSGAWGQGYVLNANWLGYPNMIIAPGTYQVIDSHPRDWSYNSGSGNQGMTEFTGYAIGDNVATLTPAEAVLTPGSSQTFTATLNGAPLTGTWLSSNINIGTITTDGNFVAVAPGEVYVSVYSGSTIGSTRVTVSSVPPSTQDTTPPAITAPADMTVEATGVATSVAIGTATATDVSGIASITNDAPATFSLGETIVTWTATDNSGLTATATQKINIVDTTAPVITAVDSMSVIIGDSSSVLTLPTVSDAVDPSPSVINNAPATFPVGYTDVTWTATDSSGNSARAMTRVRATYGYSFGEFLSPLQKDTFKAGSTIPFKFGMTDRFGNAVSTAVVQIWIDSLKNTGVSSGASNTGNYFRYDSASKQYMFNLNTKNTAGMSVGTHTIYVTLDDGTTAQTTIVLK